MSNTLDYKRQGLKVLDGLLMPLEFHESDKFREAITYSPQHGDVFVVSYPKSGTTWAQYIVWELMNDGAEPPFVNEMWFTYGAHIELVGSKAINETNRKMPR
jgi:Sulfotransferase domain